MEKIRKNTGKNDVTPQALKKAASSMNFADKLFFNAIVQMALAFEAAKTETINNQTRGE